jgi:hypothetical protein
MTVVTLLLQVVALVAAAAAAYFARETVADARAARLEGEQMHAEAMAAHARALAEDRASRDVEAAARILEQFQRVAELAGDVLDSVTGDGMLEGGVVPIPRRYPAAARQLAIAAAILERLAPSVELPKCRALVNHHRPAFAQPDCIDAVMEVETGFRNWVSLTA